MKNKPNTILLLLAPLALLLAQSCVPTIKWGYAYRDNHVPEYEFIDTITLSGYLHLIELKHPKVTKEYCAALTAPIDPDECVACKGRLLTFDVFSREEKTDIDRLISNDSLFYFYDGIALVDPDEHYRRCDDHDKEPPIICKEELEAFRATHFEEIRTTGAKMPLNGFFRLYKVDRDYFFYWNMHKVKKYDNLDIRELPEEVFVIMPVGLDRKGNSAYE